MCHKYFIKMVKAQHMWFPVQAWHLTPQHVSLQMLAPCTVMYSVCAWLGPMHQDFQIWFQKEAQFMWSVGVQTSKTHYPVKRVSSWPLPTDLVCAFWSSVWGRMWCGSAFVIKLWASASSGTDCTSMRRGYISLADTSEGFSNTDVEPQAKLIQLIYVSRNIKLVF